MFQKCPSFIATEVKLDSRDAKWAFHRSDAILIEISPDREDTKVVIP